MLGGFHTIYVMSRLTLLNIHNETIFLYLQMHLSDIIAILDTDKHFKSAYNFLVIK